MKRLGIVFLTMLLAFGSMAVMSSVDSFSSKAYAAADAKKDVVKDAAKAPEKKAEVKMEAAKKPAPKVDKTKAYLTMAVIAGAFILFLTEVIPLVATAMFVPITLVILGILKPAVAFKDFANKWTLIFLFMFMMGEALFRTGFADKVGKWAVEKGGGNERKVMLFIMGSVAVLSAFLSNTGTTVCFLPIVIAVIGRAGFSTKQFMMAMAYAASFGGTMTLIGTPPNGVANGVMEKVGLEGFGFFEFGLVGLPIAVLSIIAFLYVGVKFLPTGTIDTSGDDYEGPKIDDSFEYRSDKMPLAVGFFAFVIVIMAAGKYVPFISKTLHINLLVAAALGATLVLATKIITWKEATDSVSWTTIFLFACMFPASTALAKTGAVEMIASSMNALVAGSPIGLLIGMVLVTATLTQFASNTATTLIVVPIAIASAQGMGINPAPVVMATAMAASLCFMTPIATPPNTIVLGPGKLSFMDYIKAGWFPQLITLILVIVLVPLIWSF